MPRKKLTEDQIIQRFWDRVVLPSDKEDCWDWSGSKDKDGYGIFYKNNRAHRFSYELHNKKIKFNLQICHSCDNPSCSNPAHLWMGTTQENTQDRDLKNRTSMGDNHARKLSSKDVREIRIKYKSDQYTQRALAKEYGICQRTLVEIIQRKIWKIVV